MQHHVGAPTLIALRGGKSASPRERSSAGHQASSLDFECGDIVLAWNSTIEKEQETKDWWMAEVIGFNHPCATRHRSGMIQIACIETGTVRWLPPSHVVKVNLPINNFTSNQS